MCHMSECHINSSRAKHSLLTGSVSGDVVYLLKACVCYLVSAGILTARPSLSLSWASLSFALAASPSLNPAARQPRGMAAREREREREDWLSFRNISYSLEIHTHSHIQCWFWASLWIGSPHWVLFWPQCRWLLTYCHTCTHCLRSFCLFLVVWHGSQTLGSDRDSYYYSTNSIVSFSAQKSEPPKKKPYCGALDLWSSQGSFPDNKLTRSS